MSVPVDSKQFTGKLKQLFSQLQKNEKAMRPLQRSKLIIRMQLRQPDVLIAVNARKTPVELLFNEKGARPTLDIELPASVFHQILTEELTLTKALGDKKMEVKGPVYKAMALNELFRQGRLIYAGIIAGAI